MVIGAWCLVSGKWCEVSSGQRVVCGEWCAVIRVRCMVSCVW